MGVPKEKSLYVTREGWNFHYNLLSKLITFWKIVFYFQSQIIGHIFSPLEKILFWNLGRVVDTTVHFKNSIETDGNSHFLKGTSPVITWPGLVSIEWRCYRLWLDDKEILLLRHQNTIGCSTLIIIFFSQIGGHNIIIVYCVKWGNYYFNKNN